MFEPHLPFIQILNYGHPMFLVTVEERLNHRKVLGNGVGEGQVGGVGEGWRREWLLLCFS